MLPPFSYSATNILSLLTMVNGPLNASFPLYTVSDIPETEYLYIVSPDR